MLIKSRSAVPYVGVVSGHGLDTPGKRTPDNFKEAIYNTAVKNYYIVGCKRCNIKVLDGNPEDNDVSLSTRCNRLNKAGVDFALFIHYNAYLDDWNEANGIEVLYYSATGKKCAEVVLAELIKGTKQSNRGVKERKDLYVLKNTNMPACLGEGGFMTNEIEATLMKQPEFQIETAEEYVNATCKIFGVEYVPITAINYKDLYQKKLTEYKTLKSKYDGLSSDMMSLLKKYGAL